MTKNTQKVVDTECQGGCGKVRSVLFADSPADWLCNDCRVKTKNMKRIHKTCDYISGLPGKPSKRCGRGATVVSHRSIFIPDGKFVGWQPVSHLHYCNKHKERAGYNDYKCVRIDSIENVERG